MGLKVGWPKEKERISDESVGLKKYAELIEPTVKNIKKLAEEFGYTTKDVPYFIVELAIDLACKETGQVQEELRPRDWVYTLLKRWMKGPYKKAVLKAMRYTRLHVVHDSGYMLGYPR